MTRIPSRTKPLRVDPVPVMMADGTYYEIHPMGQTGRGPAHRIYRRTETLRGRVRTVNLVRIEEKETIDAVTKRLVQIHAEAKRDIRREQLFGKRLVRVWRWVMVFIDKMRVHRDRIIHKAYIVPDSYRTIESAKPPGESK